MGYTNPISEQNCDDVRQKLADYAVSFKGSHYLWGSCGDAPGNNINGSPYRPIATVLAKTNTDSTTTTSIFAALCNVGMGDYTCAGSYKSESVTGGGECNPSDLQHYLDGLKGPDGTTFKDESQWGPNKDGLWPRVILNGGKPGKVVWGEDCRQKQHFDCIGFINYVYITKVQGFGPEGPKDSKEKGHCDIGMWANGNAAGGPQTVVAKPPDNDPNTKYAGVSESILKPADVLVQRAFVNAPVMVPAMEPGTNPGEMVQKKDPKTGKGVMVQKVDPATGKGVTEIKISLHHIGMYAGGGMVIQANDTPVGVTYNHYDASAWHYATRLPCSKLILKP